MTLEEQKQLIEIGKAIEVIVTPTQVNGDPGVGYAGVETADFWVAFNDLAKLKASKVDRP